MTLDSSRSSQSRHNVNLTCTDQGCHGKYHYTDDVEPHPRLAMIYAVPTRTQQTLHKSYVYLRRQYPDLTVRKMHSGYIILTSIQFYDGYVEAMDPGLQGLSPAGHSPSASVYQFDVGR